MSDIHSRSSVVANIYKNVITVVTCSFSIFYRFLYGRNTWIVFAFELLFRVLLFGPYFSPLLLELNSARHSWRHSLDLSLYEEWRHLAKFSKEREVTGCSWPGRCLGMKVAAFLLIPSLHRQVTHLRLSWVQGTLRTWSSVNTYWRELFSGLLCPVVKSFPSRSARLPRIWGAVTVCFRCVAGPGRDMTATPAKMRRRSRPPKTRRQRRGASEARTRARPSTRVAGAKTR